MSKNVKIFFFISVILFIQIGIFPHLAILGIYPNIVFISLISFGVLAGFKKSLLWAILAGLFFDIYSSNNFIGVFTFNFIICVYLSFFFAQNIFKKNSISSVVSVFALIIFIYNVLNILFYKTLGIEFEFRILNFLINIIYNTIIAVPVFYSFKKIYAVGTKRI